MPIMRSGGTILVSLAILACLSSGAVAAEIRLLPEKGANSYAWIVFLSRGPIRWTSTPPAAPGQDPKSTGRAYRVVQLVSEIYDTVLIEEVTLGNEGCCVKVRAVRRVDLEGFSKAFGFIGEIAGFSFVDWQSDTSFRFRFHDREFVATGLDTPRLVIAEVGASNPALQPTRDLPR
jgi:hypothetical protein